MQIASICNARFIDSINAATRNPQVMATTVLVGAVIGIHVSQSTAISHGFMLLHMKQNAIIS